MTKTSEPNVSLTVRIPQSLFERLDDVHWEQRKPVKDIVVEALTDRVGWVRSVDE